MAGDRLELGRPCRQPKNFTPTETRVDARYVYSIDRIAGVVKRTPLHWDSREPTGFWRIAQATRAKAIWTGPRMIGRRWRRAITASALLAMAFSLFLLVYPLYPEVKYDIGSRLGLQSSVALASDKVSPINRLYVPKIGVDTPVLEGPSLDILNKAEGVWHQTGPATGNMVLAGHRWKYLPPNTSTFYNLNKLQAGDRISVDWEGKRYLYAVSQVSVVSQNDLFVLADSATPKLTLYTCYDKRQTQRVVVVADLLP